jgi:hypothetical protein
VCELERLTRADLPVGGLDRSQDCAADGNSRLQGWQINTAQRVHRHFGELQRIPRCGGVVTAGGQDRGVLDGSGHHAGPAAPTAVAQPF